MCLVQLEEKHTRNDSITLKVCLEPYSSKKNKNKPLHLLPAPMEISVALHPENISRVSHITHMYASKYHGFEIELSSIPEVYQYGYLPKVCFFLSNFKISIC